MDTLTSVAAVKQHLLFGKTVVSDVGLIEALMRGASRDILNTLNRDIFLTQYDELYRGTGTGTLVLVNYPIVSVQTVEIGSPAAARSALTADSQYVATDTSIQLLNGSVFPKGPAMARVIYVAGYSAVPDDLAEAATKVTVLRYRQLERIGQLSKVLQGETVTFDTDGWPKDVANTLENYKRRIYAGRVR